MPKVNPDILSWARETAGLNLDEAAKAIGLGSARGKTGGQRLADLEAGEGEPSRQQLARMAEKYRRPLVSFYLSHGLLLASVARISAVCPKRLRPTSTRGSTRSSAT